MKVSVEDEDQQSAGVTDILRHSFFIITKFRGKDSRIDVVTRSNPI